MKRLPLTAVFRQAQMRGRTCTRPLFAKAFLFATAVLLGQPHLVIASFETNFVWVGGGHAGSVQSVAWSPNGALIASASDDATVKLWSTNGLLLRTLATHPYQATALAFSPDGAKLAVGTYSGGCYNGFSDSNGLGRVLLWQAPNGWTGSNVTLLRCLTNRGGKVTSVAFSADGVRIASAAWGGSNYVHQVSNGNLLASCAAYTTNPWVYLQVIGAALSVAFSSRGLLASGCEDCTIRVWNTNYSQLWMTNTAHRSNVTAVTFSPDGSRLATASLDGTVRIWSTNKWTCLSVLTGHVGGVTAIAFSPNGNLIASGGEDQTIKFWAWSNGTCIATATGHLDTVTSVAFSPDGTRLVSGSRDNSLKMWSVPNGVLIRDFCNDTDFIRTLAVSPDGTLCASASHDKTIQVRRLSDGLLVRVLPGNTGCVSTITFAPDSAVLASGGGPLDPTIKLWRLADGQLLHTIPANSNGVMALAFSPDGSILASGGDPDEKTIKLWNAGDGALLQTLDGHSNGVTALAFSLRGDLLVSGGRRSGSANPDSTLKVWAVTNGMLIRAFACYSNDTESVAFSPDGDMVACGSSSCGVTNASATNLLTLWKVSDGSSRTVGAETNPVFFVAFSADGNTLASASKDTIKFWDVNSGALIQTITQETFRVTCLAYSPNGNFFVFGREDATLVAAANTLGALGRPPLLFTAITAGANVPTTLEAAVSPRTRYIVESSTNLCDWTFLTLAVG